MEYLRKALLKQTMRLFAAFVLISFLTVVKDFTCEAKKRHNGLKNSRKSRSHTYNDLKVPHTGQEVRLNHNADDGMNSGQVEVLVRDAFGIVCKNGWELQDAEVFCKQMGFLRGAKRVKFERNEHRIHTNFVIDNVSCDRDSKEIQECDWSNPGRCVSSQVAGVICKKNVGCPDGWIAGPTGCYQVLPNIVTKQEFAVNKCLARGGHLVTIETDLENHFISNAFWNFTHGPILTGGVQRNGKWMWEKITNETDGRQTTYDQIVDTHWFPGWQPGNVLPQPTTMKKHRCLYLSNNFQTPNETKVNVGYHFWMNERCGSTRKRFHNGFHYMCERPIDRSQDSVGCMIGIGTQYRGTTSYTNKGTPCMKWTDSTDINPQTYPNMGLGDHNYCRNPDNDDKPWCWVSDGEFEFCDIPQCLDTDENHSQHVNGTCQNDEFTCNNDKCIPYRWVCDMEHDCENGEDERQDCDYMLNQFVVSRGHTVTGHVIEMYAGATNETCAKYCMNSTRFLCKAFSFSPITRECKLSDKNSEDVEFRSSRITNVYEVISQLVDCDGMYQCDNGRCVSKDVICDGHDQCGDFSDEAKCGGDTVSVRLVGGTKLAGLVEVSYKDEWGVVCDDDWDKNDAIVVCRMLGYTGDAQAVTRSNFGFGNGRFLLDDVNCTGTEESISECDHAGWKQHDCYSWEVAGVKCSEEVNILECQNMKEYKCIVDQVCISLNEVCDGKCQCEDCADEHDCEAKVELVNGDNQYEGRVEIILNGIRGTICDDNFSDVDARVICKMLGYNSGVSTNGGLFGQGNGTIWMDEVLCHGNETDIITQCPHYGPRDQNCGHDEDVGVICMTETDGVSVSLEHGPNKYSGRVILTRNGENGTICDDDWDDVDAEVICRMLGYSGGIALDGEFYGPGNENLHIFLDNVKCNGDEDHIGECPHDDWFIHNCDHTEDAAVKCTIPDNHLMSTTVVAKETTVTIQVQVTSPEDCLDKNSQYAGRIAVTENGFECQNWSFNSPHTHKHHNDSAFPDGSVLAAKNYCRSPDGDSQPWCYTMHPDERWGYCNIPICKANCYIDARSYTGPTSVTTSGYTCQTWALNTPHKHKYVSSEESFPDDSIAEAANHCRAPDGDPTPWCYTTNPNVRWEYCNISRCSGGGQFDFGASCGQRPLEISRARRDVHDADDDVHSSFNDLDSSDLDSGDLDLSLYHKQGKIYGGSQASYGMYPWQAGIRRRMSGLLSYHLHHCGATIIGEYWVLSAAHCFRDISEGQIVVRTGDLHLGHRDKYEQEFNVEAVYMHNNYQNFDFDNDIALVKLSPVRGRGIVFNDYVQPACLPNVTTEYRPGQKCLISGWGEHEDGSHSSYLRASRIPLVDRRTCNRLHKHTITRNMACAGYMAGGTDTCSGDSGGPLVCKINDKYTVMGVVSFGEGCGRPNSPGVYARVASFIPWIKSILSQ